MSERLPPKLASWLLNKYGSPYHGESLAGDLIEQYQEGRSRAWYWRQVGAAILIAWGRSVRAIPWTLVSRAVLRLVAEAAAVLAVVVIVDREQRAQFLVHRASLTFIGVLVALIALAVGGYIASIRPNARNQRRAQRRAAIMAMLLVFGVIAVGVGTLTWAGGLRGDVCFFLVCVCAK